MNPLDTQLRADLEARQQADLYRRRRVLASPQGARVRIDGGLNAGVDGDGQSKNPQCCNFSSNDYLGLANHPEVIAAFQAAANLYGVGSGASHLISGHSREHHALEEELAEFTGRQRALLFSTGYMANVGVLNALAGSGDLLLEDRLNHASLLDGGFLCRAQFERYPHGDLSAVQDHLNSGNYRRKFIATDGVFSMDGDVAPLPALAELAETAGAALMVDDAHGFGVLGKHGGGVVEQLGLSAQQVPILMGTLGKAFGTFGAFVAGSDTLIETLIQFGRTYIYTTALPPAIAAATRASLKLVQSEPGRREKLKTLIERFRTGAAQLDIPLTASSTAIQPVMIGDDHRVSKLGQILLDQGFWVGAIRPPTVPSGGARLRITLTAGHSDADVDGLLLALHSALRETR